MELLLPGDVDGSGYPGGVKQQFGAVRSMVEAILLQLKQLPDFQVLLIAAHLSGSTYQGPSQPVHTVSGGENFPLCTGASARASLTPAGVVQYRRCRIRGKLFRMPARAVQQE